MVVLEEGYEWKDDCKDDCIDYCINETDLDLLLMIYLLQVPKVRLIMTCFFASFQ